MQTQKSNQSPLSAEHDPKPLITHPHLAVRPITISNIPEKPLAIHIERIQPPSRCAGINSHTKPFAQSLSQRTVFQSVVVSDRSTRISTFSEKQALSWNIQIYRDVKLIKQLSNQFDIVSNIATIEHIFAFRE